MLSLFVALALFAACAAGGSGVAAAADEVAVWHYKITVNRTVAGEGESPSFPKISAAVSVEESLSPLVLEFDVNQDVEPIRDTMKASYEWSSKERQNFEGSLLFRADGRGQGSTLEDWEVVLSRHFDPIDCYSGHYVDDDWERQMAPFLPPWTMSPPADHEGVGQGPSPWRLYQMRVDAITADKALGDRLQFSIRAEFPVTVTYHNYDSGETTTDTWTQSFQDSGKVEYAFQLQSQERRLKPETGVFGSGVILPKINLAQNRIDVDISRKPVELTLTASPGKGSSIRFKNKIVVDGVDCSRLLKVHRFERDWFHMYDPKGTNTSWELVNDWRAVTDDGDHAAEREVSFENFFPPKSPRSAWGNRTYFTEFLDSVDRLPELGFFYHVVFLETHEKGNVPMEITAYKARQIDADEWCDLFINREINIFDTPAGKPLATVKLP